MVRFARVVFWLALLAAGVGAESALAQGVLVPPSGQHGLRPSAGSPIGQSGLQAMLRQLSDQAGVIFFGEVMAIRMGTGSPGFASGVVEVDFRVEAAVRGCVPGIYTLREWGGLWGAAADQRYRPGQHALVFLHAPGPSGLSSPVMGLDGVLPIIGIGAAPGPLDTTTQAGSAEVDLRWLQTHVVRGIGGGASLHPMPHEDAGQNGAAAQEGSLNSSSMSPLSMSPLPMSAGWGQMLPSGGESVEVQVQPLGVPEEPVDATTQGADSATNDASAMNSVDAANAPSVIMTSSAVLLLLRSWEEERRVR